MMDRRQFLKKTAVTAAGLGFAGTRNLKINRKPNIIYILADDLGYGDLGCYGQEKIKTPCLDKMAAEGMKFTDHYSGNTVCAPSRCSLITGLHPGHSYIRGNVEIKPHGQQPIPADTLTIAKLMKKAGYATGCIGKWGLGYNDSTGDPMKQGFDHFFGYLCQRNAHDYYPEYVWRNGEQVILNKEKYTHDLMTTEVLGFLDDHKDEPFFLYLPYTIPHIKFQVPELGQYENKAWQEEHKIQAAMISRLDRDCGRILESLKKLGIEDNTLVIFTSDNGAHGKTGTLEFFNASGKLRGFKRDLHEGGIRAPFIASWPGRIEAGSTSDHISAFWDMMPTFCELAGEKPPKDTDGISMLPALLGNPKQQKHKYLYWEWSNSKAVRSGKWKAVESSKGGFELFDLDADISEKINIADKHPEIAAKLKAYMTQAHTPLPEYPRA